MKDKSTKNTDKDKTKKRSAYRQLVEDMRSHSSKSTVAVYFTVRLLIIFTLVHQALIGNYYNVFLCAVSLVLILTPAILERKFKINLPSTLEIVVIVFVFCAEILGEINSFYIHIPIWDTLLHTTTGFWAASVGFAFIDLINQNAKRTHMAPVFVAIVTFCFSMTVAVVWEFFEFGADMLFNTDMQKDSVVTRVDTTYLDETRSNQTVHIKGIDRTVMYDSDGNELAAVENGYLDVGVRDTMKDMFVNMLGAAAFTALGFLYLKRREKYKFVESIIVSKDESRTE